MTLQDEINNYRMCVVNFTNNLVSLFMMNLNVPLIV